MRRQLLPALRMTVALTVILGLLYPLVVTAAAQVVFKTRADGSLVKNTKGEIVGSSLVGQLFVDGNGGPDPRYFEPRPSAAGTGYDPLASSGTNLGPSNPKLIAPATGPDCYLVDKTDADGNAVLGPDGSPLQECYGDTVPARVDNYRQLNNLDSSTAVPVDAVTASGSGLDPHISVANAKLQAARVAKQRGLPVDIVQALIAKHTEGRQWGVLGEKVVNVLELNLDLDRQS